MTGEELRRRGFLYFEGIREGLENFEYEIAGNGPRTGASPFP